jgi:energy-converting hydrogenase Eha subunit H
MIIMIVVIVVSVVVVKQQKQQQQQQQHQHQQRQQQQGKLNEENIRRLASPCAGWRRGDVARRRCVAGGARNPSYLFF